MPSTTKHPPTSLGHNRTYVPCIRFQGSFGSCFVSFLVDCLLLVLIVVKFRIIGIWINECRGCIHLHNVCTLLAIVAPECSTANLHVQYDVANMTSWIWMLIVPHFLVIYSHSCRLESRIYASLVGKGLNADNFVRLCLILYWSLDPASPRISPRTVSLMYDTP